MTGVLTITTGGRTTIHTYQYDEFNRLIADTPTATRREYTYDAAGGNQGQGIRVTGNQGQTLRNDKECRTILYISTFSGYSPHSLRSFGNSTAAQRKRRG